MRGVACFHSKGFEEDFGPQDADRYSDVAERGQGEKRAGEGVRGALDEVISELCARAGDGPDGGGTLLRGLDRRIDEDDVKGGGVLFEAAMRRAMSFMARSLWTDWTARVRSPVGSANWARALGLPRG